MKITRKARNIKSRYVGMVDDIDFKSSIVSVHTHFIPQSRVYSDELPLTDPDWCMTRSCDILLRSELSDRMYAAATAWVNLGCKLQSIKNSFKKI